jgi:hypothetical protein
VPMAAEFDGLIWFALALLGLTFLQRLLHSEVQLLLMYLTRNFQWTIRLFALLFLPGVLLHELSHYLMARLLGVRTGRFSLIPRPLSDGRLRLGYVEVGATDMIRSTLIGMAPLIAGLGLIFVIAQGMHLAPLWAVLRDGNWPLFWFGLSLLPRIPNFPFWFYLTLVISSTMLPSDSDRQGWLPLALLLSFLAGLILLGGGGPWLMQNILAPLSQFLRDVSLLLFFSILVHLLAYLPLALLRRLLLR